MTIDEIKRKYGIVQNDASKLNQPLLTKLNDIVKQLGSLHSKAYDLINSPDFPKERLSEGQKAYSSLGNLFWSFSKLK